MRAQKQNKTQTHFDNQEHIIADGTSRWNITPEQVNEVDGVLKDYERTLLRERLLLQDSRRKKAETNRAELQKLFDNAQ